jgi:ABC-type branched-subunit amino acid transport system substrate-binding protein
MFAAVMILFSSLAAADDVKIGLNYPKTGPYEVQGLAQLRAAEMAVDEINKSGGILGRKIVIIVKDSESKADVATRNVEDLIDKDGVEMVFGGSASSVAIAGGLAARSRGKIYFGTLTYSNETTGSEGHKYMFRECYSSWMGAKVLSKYMTENFTGKKYFYITADYTWGRTTEESIRKFSNTEDTSKHKGVLTPFPSATDQDFKKALTEAKFSNPDVLVLVLFGNDMVQALKLATAMGLKQKMAVVVPNLTLGMAKSAGPKVMEGVVGAVPWEWNIPYKYNYPRGIKFVEDFSARYSAYPSTSAASAYSILYQYKDAVERAKSFDSKQVIAALEDHRYSLLKDEQWWRPFDHQNIQTVYAVKCKPLQEVLKDKYQEDFFEVINTMPGAEAAKTREEWNEERRKANKPLELEW